MRIKQIRTAINVFLRRGLPGVAKVALTKLAAMESSEGDDSGPAAWTDYMNWLNYANAGMICRGNVQCFDHAVQNLPSEAPMIEIGSFCGLSTNVLTHLKDKHGRLNALITCDRWLFEGVADQYKRLADTSSITHAEYRMFVKDAYMRNVRFFSRSNLPFTVELLSDEFFACWEHGDTRKDVLGREIRLGGPISFAYIDGNHEYEYARRDFLNCDRYLERGGYILFDDSADGSGFGVCRVVDEVIATDRYELLTKKGNYFFRKR